MVTSLVMEATDHQNATNPSVPFPQDQDHHPIRRSSGRRKSSKGCESSSAAGQKKKQPQRGMGVEKLERLRLQDWWKKMTSTTMDINHQALTNVTPFSDPTNLMNAAAPPVSVQLPQLAATPNVGQHQMGCNLGFHWQMGVGGLASDQLLHTNLSGIGRLNNNFDFYGKNVMASGFSKEPSSTPNVVNCYSHQHCNACHKKKKANGDQNLGLDMMYKQMSSVGDCGFLGLTMGDNHQNIISQENQALGTKIPLVGYAVGKTKKGIEVDRKGCASERGGCQVLMEYDFFPSSGSGSQIKDDELVTMKKLLGPSETSSMAAGFDASNCIDLSLKLSY